MTEEVTIKDVIKAWVDLVLTVLKVVVQVVLFILAINEVLENRPLNGIAYAILVRAV